MKRPLERSFWGANRDFLAKFGFLMRLSALGNGKAQASLRPRLGKGAMGFIADHSDFLTDGLWASARLSAFAGRRPSSTRLQQIVDHRFRLLEDALHRAAAPRCAVESRDLRRRQIGTRMYVRAS